MKQSAFSRPPCSLIWYALVPLSLIWLRFSLTFTNVAPVSKAALRECEKNP